MSVSREKVDKKVKERGWENVWKHSDYVFFSNWTLFLTRDYQDGKNTDKKKAYTEI